MRPRTEAGRKFADDWAPVAINDHERGCPDCGGVIREEHDELVGRVLAIEAEAIAARDAELRARLPQALADADDAGSVADDWTGSEYVDRLAAALLDQPVVPMSPEP